MREWFPFFAAVDVATSANSWCVELRQAYEPLVLRRGAVAATYAEYATDLSHYCDGATVRQRFRPADLPTAKSCPPLTNLCHDASAKPPSQRKLAAIVHHEGFLATADAARRLDAAEAAAGTPGRRDREATRLVSVAQPYAGEWLAMLPTSPATRVKSDEWLWAMQRRFGLHLTAPAAVFRQLAALGDTRYDPLGDVLMGESRTDQSLPHDESLRVWHDATQAVATGSVVLGDKEQPEVYAIYNEGPDSCVVDLAEAGLGHGGADLCVEHKVWGELVAPGASSEYETTHRGDTHAFGNTEERAIRKVLGVKARAGERRWDSTEGAGAVREHRGQYHDAIVNKRNTVVLTLHNLWGGFAPGAVKRLLALEARAEHTDRTQYEHWSASAYVSYWTQRISASIVKADARRCLRRLPGLARSVLGAAPRRRGRAT